MGFLQRALVGFQRVLQVLVPKFQGFGHGRGGGGEFSKRFGV